MHTDDDATLLQAWTGLRSEEAFRRLVERYAGLVFGAALRRSGDAGLAAEAAQDVFVRLAQHAAEIRRAESLPAWLHAAAVHAAGDRLRKESRHRERMKRYGEETLASADSAGDSQAWREALPLLDEAIGRLSETDRGIVLARYCQGESVADAARRFGLSPSAAQKRSERALEKLAGVLRRRGVVLTVTVLASGLGDRMAQAVSADMGSQWCAAALSAGKAGTAAAPAAWMAFMNAKVASVAAALTAIAIPVGLQLSANTRAHPDSETAGTGETQPRPSPGDHAAARSPAGAIPARQVVNGLNLSALAREIRAFPPHQGRLQKELELRAAVLTLDTKQCAAVARWLAEAPGVASLSDVVFDLFSRWESLDREGALAAATEMRSTPLGSGPESAVLHAWSAKDPQGMLARFSPDIGKDAVGQRAFTACEQATRAWAERDPRAALGAAMSMSARHWNGAKLVDAALMGWASGVSPDEPLAWLENEASAEVQLNHYSNLIGYLQDNFPDKAWQTLLRWPDRTMAEDRACSTLNMWAGHDPDAALAAWLSGPPEWRNKHFAFNLSQVLAYANPAALRRLAAEYPDPKVRETFAMMAKEKLDKTPVGGGNFK